MNQGIHGISLLLDLMGPVSSVTALTRTLAHNIEVEDTAAAVLELQNGAIGTIVGATSVVPGYPRVLSVHGTKGSVCMREDAIAKWDIPGQEQQIGSVSDAKTFANSAAFSAQLHKRQIEDFITSVEKQTAPTVGFQQGRRAVELILAIYESSRTGKTIFMGREDENRVVE